MMKKLAGPVVEIVSVNSLDECNRVAGQLVESGCWDGWKFVYGSLNKMWTVRAYHIETLRKINENKEANMLVVE